MNDRPARAGKLPVDLQGLFVWSVADAGVKIVILGKPHGKLVEAVLVLRHMQGQLHVEHSSLHALQPGHSADFTPVMHGNGPAQLLQLPQRPLPQPAVPDGKLPRNAHLACPGLVLFAKRNGIPVLQPADHHAPSVGHEYGLRGVEVDAVIDGLVLLLLEHAGLFVEVPDQAQGPVAVVVFEALRQHILRTGEQHPFPVQREKVRALPHPAEAAVIFRQFRLVGPVEAVPAFKQQDLSAAVCRPAADQRKVAAIRRMDDLGIAEVVATGPLRQLRRIDHRIALIFIKVHAVSDSNILGLDLDGTAVLAVLQQHTGIHQKQPSVRQFHSASGKAPIVVIDLVRRKCCRQKFPVQHVAAHGVSPMHAVPMRRIGIILVEHVVFSAVITKSVRVVHPSGTRSKMKERAFIFVDLSFQDLLRFSCLPQRLANDHGYPRFFLIIEHSVTMKANSYLTAIRSGFQDALSHFYIHTALQKNRICRAVINCLYNWRHGLRPLTVRTDFSPEIIRRSMHPDISDRYQDTLPDHMLQPEKHNRSRNRLLRRP